MQILRRLPSSGTLGRRLVMALFAGAWTWGASGAQPVGGENPIVHDVGYPLTAYREHPEWYYERQARVSLDLASELLKANPPALTLSPGRRAALILVDHVMHDDAKASSRRAVENLFHAAVDGAIASIRAEQVTSGATIWKIYNHGFVVKTASVVIGFDLTRCHSVNDPGFAIPEATMGRLVALCDVLFVSHRHLDHADEWVAAQFLASGKPVIAPEEVWKAPFMPFYPKVTHLRRSPTEKQVVPLGSGKPALTVTCYPGHQTVVDNNVVLVTTPEKLTFAHTGDENSTGTADREWMKTVSRSHPIDVLMMNCWSPDAYEILRGFAPRLVITGHENELGHEIFYRYPNWLTMDLLEKEPTPHVFLMWGENFHYDSARQ